MVRAQWHPPLSSDVQTIASQAVMDESCSCRQSTCDELNTSDQSSLVKPDPPLDQATTEGRKQGKNQISRNLQKWPVSSLKLKSKEEFIWFIKKATSTRMSDTHSEIYSRLLELFVDADTNFDDLLKFDSIFQLVDKDASTTRISSPKEGRKEPKEELRWTP